MTSILRSWLPECFFGYLVNNFLQVKRYLARIVQSNLTLQEAIALGGIIIEWGS